MNDHPSLPFNGMDGLPELADEVLSNVRAKGADCFRAQGFPAPGAEAWKYTRLPAINDMGFRMAVATDGTGYIVRTAHLADEQVAARLIFVNGQPRADLSHTGNFPPGVRLEPLSVALKNDPAWLNGHLGASIGDSGDGLVSLNDAALAEGFVLVVDAGVCLEKPVEIIHFAFGTDIALAWFPRNLVVIGENAEATLVVRHLGGMNGRYFTNAVSEFSMADNARLRLYTLDEAGTGITAVTRNFTRLAHSSALQTFSLMSGDGMSRLEQTVHLEGEGAEAIVDGIYLLRGSAHADSTTRVEHRVPNTTCNEVFKGVVDDTARAVFQGKIVVCKGAQHTDGQMLNKTLLLGEKAEIDSKPELEIYADDVKCAHGATSGKIDEGALFYLRSRGIPARLASNLLVRSFLGEVTERISNSIVRDLVAARVEQWLPDASHIDRTEQAA